MSFKEKSIIASLFTTLLVWGFYFSNLVGHLREGTLTLGAVGGLLLGAVIVTIIIEVISQSIIAGYAGLRAGQSDLPADDERDRAIVYRASFYGSYLLGAGVVLAVVAALVTQSLVVTLNVLILHFVGSEVLVYLLQLYFYRRGF